MQEPNRIADFGQLVLLLSLVVATWAGAAAAVGARRGSRRLVRSAVHATYGVAALLTLASTVIFFAILSNDYSIKYVQHYSDATMPWFYKVTSYWGGLDGSMMFWAWILSLFTALAVFVNRERHRELIPWVIATLMVTLDFFLLLVIFAKRPFDTFLTAAPNAGQGLNPLLQNPYMATHPPSLYIGLVSCAVPYAFAMAALITGNLDDSWLRSVRRWVLVSWFFLSLGLTLGMLWAYEVLGWGGYWGWDPVENAGSLAWFTSTAFLHSIIIQERRGMLKVWNVFLVLAGFLLTLIATFLTRSGIVQSVHAFGSDPVLKMSFLAFMAFIFVLSFGLLIYRLPLLRSRGELDSWVSREFAFLVNNWVLLAAALFILVATLFPSLSEWVTGTRVTLATPFYNQWMAPIGLLLLGLTGVGPLLAWRRATPKNLVEQFAFPAASMVVTLVVLSLIPGMRAKTPFLSEKLLLPMAILDFAFCAFVVATVAQEFWRGARVRQKHTGLDLFTSLIGLVGRNKRRYGGYVVHIGIVLMFLGFGGGAYKRETEVTLQKGQKTTLGAYSVQFDELRPLDTAEKKIVAAVLTISRDGKTVGRAVPAKWYFPHHEEEPVSHVEIGRGLVEDLYLVLNGYDVQAGLVNLKIVIQPLVNWIWFGFVLLAMGATIAFLPERAYALAAKEARDASDASAATGTLALALLVGAGLLFGGAGTARAQAPPPPGPAAPAAAGTPGLVHGDANEVRSRPYTADENELFHQIVCMCGTCGRELLSSCTCAVAKRMREEVSGMLERGMSKDDIIAAYVARWPKESPLAKPPDTGFNRLAWAFPYAAILLGLGGLVVAARRITSRSAVAAADKPDAADGAPGAREALESRLDDELDALD